eukprot:gene22592-25598_t
MSEKHECKATYLTCAFEAIHGNSDHDLAQLWSLAVRNLDEDIQLKLETSYQSVTTTSSYLQKAESIKDNITRNKHHWSAKLLCLYERQFRNNSRAAVMWALQRPHLYNYAVETCSKTIKVRARIDRSELDAEVEILERASSNLQQVLEIIEVNAEDCLSDTFNTMKSNNQAPIAAADQLILNADRVFEFVAAVDNRKAELACTVSAESKCRDITMRRVWQILRIEQEEALLKTEACLQDVLSSGGPIGVSAELIRFMAVNRAMQSLQKDQTSGLANKCWTQAAVHMEAAAQDTENETVLDEAILAYTQTAEYLHLAFKHRALPNSDIKQNGSRVASWYE